MGSGRIARAASVSRVVMGRIRTYRVRNHRGGDNLTDLGTWHPQ